MELEKQEVETPRIPEGPSEQQIQEWKNQFGEVFVSVFSDTEKYIWRPIIRSEWISLHSYISSQGDKVTQYNFEEMICDTCILWKSNKISWDKVKAGTIGALNEQILQASNFVDPQTASYLVAKL